MITRVTEMLGLRYPIVQAGMSWASSCAALPIAVSKAGGLGVIAAGPLGVDDLRALVRTVTAALDGLPFAVNIPLTRSAFAAAVAEADRDNLPIDEYKALLAKSSLRLAAIDGNVEWGKVEAGQSAGLISEILPAAEVMRRLVDEMAAARQRLSAM